jgi:hypothetical protein
MRNVVASATIFGCMSLIAGASGCGVDRPAVGATGGNGGAGDVGGAGGTGVGAGCQGPGGAGPEGTSVEPGRTVGQEGFLELLAGDLGDPAFPPLTDPPVGNGLSIRLPSVRGMAVVGAELYVAAGASTRPSNYRDVQRQSYLLDFATGQVGPIPTASSDPVLAGAFAGDGDGTLYFASFSCEVYRLAARGRCPELVWPGPPKCINAVIDTPVVSRIGLAFLGGHLYLTDSYGRGVLDLDPGAQLGSPVPDTNSLQGPLAMAAGPDGMLYVSTLVYSDNNHATPQVFRVDPILGGAEFFATGGWSLATDAVGHLFIGDVTSVDRIDLATGDRVVVAGIPSDPMFPDPQAEQVVPGPLPGNVGRVMGIAATASGDLIIASGNLENVLLLARLSTARPIGTP